AVALQPALELGEESEILAHVRIGVQHEAMKEIAIAVLRTFAPVCVLKILVTLARFATQREPGRSIAVQWDELHVVEKIRAKLRVAQSRPILVLSRQPEVRVSRRIASLRIVRKWQGCGEHNVEQFFHARG